MSVMNVLKDTVVQGSLALGNLVSGERDRPAGSTQGALPERMRRRVRAVATEGAAKTAVSVGAPHAAREIARRVGDGVIGRVAAHWFPGVRTASPIGRSRLPSAPVSEF